MNSIDKKKEVTMQVRVELSHLLNIDGFYFLNNVLFTGLAYDHRDEQLYKVYQITAGKMCGEQEYGFFNYPGFVKLDYSVIDDYFDPEFETIYQGKLFNGIAYGYRDGFVSSELLWINGYNVETVQWYPDGSGLLRRYDTDYDEHKSRFEWHYKQLISAEVRKGHIASETSFSLVLNEQNRLKSCVLYGEHLADLGPVVERSDLPLPANTLAGLLAHYEFADEITLNINNETNFNYFIAHTSFYSIQKLELVTKNLSLGALALLMDLPRLQSIFFKAGGVSDYQLQRLDEQERRVKQQQCDERNHALLALLFAIQAKQHCNIELTASSGLVFVYSYAENGEGKIIANVNESDFDYLLNTLPLANITELDLRQTALPIAVLQNLAKFSHLKYLSIKENIIYDFSRTEPDDKAKAMAEQQCQLRDQALWGLLVQLQAQLRCDIKLISQSRAEFEQLYRG